MWECSWGTGVAIGMDWMYLVRVTGSVVDLPVFWVGVPHIIFKENCLTIYYIYHVCIYVYVMLLLL